MVILNLKNYPEATANNLTAVLSEIESAVRAETKIVDLVAVVPAIYDLHLAVEKAGNLQIFSPHVDAKAQGSTTGWVPAQALLSLNINYSVLNHSEHRFGTWEELEYTIKQVQEEGLKVVVCCENLEEAQKLLALNPFAIAYEDKDLIGSGQSITTGRPEEVKKFIELAKGKTKVIIGAGISTGEDVKQGLEFGAEGFILASAFVKAENKKDKILELAMPFLN